MNYYYITGTSRGIGKALAERLLQDPDNRVTGLARGNDIQHPHYRHIGLDLSDLAQVQRFAFESCPDARRIVLVNNAGVYIAETVGKLSPEAIIQAYHVNLVAPALFANGFINAYRKLAAEKLILNIGSKAGRAPVYGISTMCAPKAGIDMLSRVIAEEQKLVQDAAGFRVLSVAPGMVDTAMYATRRRAMPDDPIRQSLMAKLGEERPADPRRIADQLYRLIEEPDSVREVVVSLDEFH
jgi:benzil reductase ((S)-benzoin forming)